MKFSELTGRAKDVAREKLIELLNDLDWWTLGAYDDAQRLISDRTGVEIDEENLYFQLSYSQGDYARIEFPKDTTVTEAMLKSAEVDPHALFSEKLAPIVDGTDVDLATLVDDCADCVLDERVETSSGRGYASFYITGGVYLEAVVDELVNGDLVDADQADDLYAAVDELDARIEKMLRSMLLDLEQDVYRIIRDFYEDITSDEALADFAEANDIEFSEDGELL